MQPSVPPTVSPRHPPGRPVRWHAVEGNRQRLDGGAMFGNAPRALWQRWAAPDADNRIPLACRALLVEEDSGRRVLCEAGIGAFFEPALAARFGVEETRHVLLDNLAALGLGPADIDVIVLSHLHFDHAGGLLTAWALDAAPALAFPEARVVVSRAAWERALHPHARDRASFIPALPALLGASAGGLEIVESDAAGHVACLGDPWRVHLSEGHTPGLMLAEVALPDGPLCFAGDLIPGAAWMHAAITMGYDRFPEQLIDEKVALLSDLERRAGRVFFTHDPERAVGRVGRDARGNFAALA
jgi:glyoxylase-like metal-dependent hydrolase (beta-lactamase superfamily II)